MFVSLFEAVQRALHAAVAELQHVEVIGKSWKNITVQSRWIFRFSVFC